MTPSEISEKVDELIGCLGIWGVSLKDALEISYTMRMRLKTLTSMPVGIPIVDSEQEAKNRQRVNHEPLERNNDLFYQQSPKGDQ